MLCTKCGKEIDENLKFCPHCGNAIGTISTGDSVKSEMKIPNVENVKSAGAKVKNFFDTLVGVIIALVIFAWNSYAIVHNFCVRDGYFWAILGIIVNVLILIFVDISSIIPKINSKVGYGIFAAIFIICAVIGFKPFTTLMEESAIPVVNQILEETYGSYAAECTSVTILKETGKYEYRAIAYLDNGNNLDINIEYYKKTKQVAVTIPY